MDTGRLTFLAFRYGVVPICCFGSSLSLVFYSTVWGVHAAKWNAAAPGVSRQFANHAATAATGAVITGVVGIEACHDWLSNRQAGTLEELTAALMKRRVFFLRTPVLVLSALATGATLATFGEFRVAKPSVPVGLFGKSAEGR